MLNRNRDAFFFLLNFCYSEEIRVERFCWENCASVSFIFLDREEGDSCFFAATSRMYRRSGNSRSK